MRTRSGRSRPRRAALCRHCATPPDAQTSNARQRTSQREQRLSKRAHASAQAQEQTRHHDSPRIDRKLAPPRVHTRKFAFWASNALITSRLPLALLAAAQCSGVRPLPETTGCPAAVAAGALAIAVVDCGA